MNTRRRVSGILLSAALTAMLWGCQPGPSTAMSATINDYRAGRYGDAYSSAVKVRANAKSRTAREAQYMAGMSAYRLGRYDDAINHLTKVADAPEDEIAGPSVATIGLILAGRGDHARALEYYTRAVKRLTGNDQARAYYHMAVTEQALGRWAQARPHLTLAATRATDPDLKAMAEYLMRTSGFTLQFGAYSLQRNAEDRVRAVGRLAQQTGLGAPRIVALESSGRTLYHVQAGNFGTYEAALAAKQRLKLNEVSVERMPDGAK